ncbi:hypothetical protein A8C56_23735 [Niabella ginsenosidivorans]|uniref:Uncharacterized protein n=1 Tax=Niabella ginsenosidivorans TaxID=1176587 RepID=A0A1A9I8B7_9BACT|nr:hypothetical protein A8C56_23735 [Niabella ginsenosidivorans]
MGAITGMNFKTPVALFLAMIFFVSCKSNASKEANGIREDSVHSCMKAPSRFGSTDNFSVRTPGYS